MDPRLEARIRELRETRNTANGQPLGRDNITRILAEEGWPVNSNRVRRMLETMRPTEPKPFQPSSQPSGPPKTVDDLLALLIRRKDEGIDPRDLAQYPEGATSILSAQGRVLVVKGGRLALERDPKTQISNDTFKGVFDPSRRVHRFAVISDSHFGGKQAQPAFIWEILREADRRNCDAILHCGDIVDGSPRMHAGFVYELVLRSVDEQVDYAAQVFRESQIPIYAVGGNHDGSWFKDCGIDVLRILEGRLDNFHSLGPIAGWLGGPNGDPAFIRISHPGKGSSYARSYPAQKEAEYLVTENSKVPSGFNFSGHFHKRGWFPGPHGTRFYLVPSTCGTTAFMRSKSLINETGAYFFEYTIDREGRVDRCIMEDIPLWPSQWKPCDYSDFDRPKQLDAGKVWSI